MKLEEHVEWLTAQEFVIRDSWEICQCGTEKVIRRSSNPKRMRAELLSYSFLDQFIHTYFIGDHDRFKVTFPGPKLCSHVCAGHASPGWLVYSHHGYDTKADWQIVRSIFHDYLNGGLVWLSENHPVNGRRYWNCVKDEINVEFERQHISRFIDEAGILRK